MIHLEGMGWLGAATAYALHARDVPFTWSDLDVAVRAWPASTGMVYPDGEPDTALALTRWGDWLREDRFPAGTVIPSAWCFAHKAPPHSGRYTYTDYGWIRVAHSEAYTVDVPAIVAAARDRFGPRRLAGSPPGVRTVRTHGFTDTFGYLWGWSAPVRLNVPEELLTVLGETRPAFYGQAHRFAITYAYPIPTKPGWWRAGSSMIAQHFPRNLNAAAAYARWEGYLPEVYGGRLSVAAVGDPVQGWRPRPHAHLDGVTVRVDERTGAIVYPAMAHSGIRHAPLVIDAALRRLGVTP